MTFREFWFAANIFQVYCIKSMILKVWLPILCQQTICLLDIPPHRALFWAVWRMSKTNHYSLGVTCRCGTLLIRLNDWWVPLRIVRKHWKRTKNMGKYKTCNASNNVIQYTYNMYIALLLFLYLFTLQSVVVLQLMLFYDDRKMILLA